MSQEPTRRAFLTTAAVAASAAWLGPLGAAGGPAPEAPGTPAAGTGASALPATWPAQAPELAREVVGASHGNLARVKELVGRHRTLAAASWDWGFGDWETALGAASHVGNREIAAFLLANGARPNLFSAAMLGQLDVVRAFVQASPGVQSITGPHGLTLLHHARAGGEPAAGVLAYLEELGGADPRPTAVPLAEPEATALHGVYGFGPGETEQIEIGANRAGLYFERKGTFARNLTHLGALEFLPAGAPAVRIRFQQSDGRVMGLTVHDPDLVVSARRR